MDDELNKREFYFRIRYVDEPPYFKIRFVGKDKAIIEGVECVEMPKRQPNKEIENDEMLQN